MLNGSQFVCNVSVRVYEKGDAKTIRHTCLEVFVFVVIPVLIKFIKLHLDIYEPS